MLYTTIHIIIDHVGLRVVNGPASLGLNPKYKLELEN